MARDEERKARSTASPIVAGLPDLPGILTAINLTPGLGTALRGLANELLVADFPGATLTRGERELLATAVSAANDCFYCMDSHGAFAAELLARASTQAPAPVIDAIKSGRADGLDAKMSALVVIARKVQRRALDVTREDVQRALDAGASDADTQLAVLIAAAFCMYNRMVDGFRAHTPPTEAAFVERAKQIADHGYADPRLVAIPK